MDDLISVIVPVYNAKDYLDRCIGCIVNQTYQNLEIILVDDGSTDKSADICDDYAKKDSRIRVIHKENGGVSSARNEGLRLVCGQWIVWMDSDDFMKEDAIEKMLSLALKESVDIVKADFTVFMTEEDLKASQSADPISKETISGRDCIVRMHTISDEHYVVLWGALYRKELFDNVEFPVGRVCEDLAVLYKVYDRANDVVILNNYRAYYYFRDNANSATHELKDSFYEDAWAVLEDEISYMDKEHPELAMYPRKTQMYWLFDYFSKLYSRKDKSGRMSDILKSYRMRYKEAKALPKDKFYTAFYYAPKLYTFIRKKRLGN